jgi:hypothetical protein
MSESLTTKECAIELRGLAKAINESEATIQALYKGTIDKALEAVSEAILQGQRLVKTKALIRGADWEEWLKAHCPSLNMKKARRYMVVAARAPYIAEMDDENKLRQTLLLFNGGDTTEPTPAQPWPAYIEGLKRFALVVKFISGKDKTLNTWPESARTKLRDELEPVVRQLWPELLK